MSEEDLIKAGQTVIAFRHAVQECNLDRIASFIKKILTERLWAARVEGVPGRFYECGNVPEFITAKPIRGCGWPLDKITHLLKQSGNEEVLEMWRKATTAPRGGDHRSEKYKADRINHNNVMIEGKQGNSKAYTLDRLEREQPELYRRVIAKKLSANAAAIEAGWRKQLTALELLRKDWKKATTQERETFRKEIDEKNGISIER